MVSGLWKYSKVILRWTFAHPVQNKPCVWLHIFPELQPTDITEKRESTKVSGNWFNSGGKERQKNRSKTFPGIAKAMAEQWGDYLLTEDDASPERRCP